MEDRVIPRKKRSEPGSRLVVGTSLAKRQVDRIDAICAREDLSRSTVLRRAVGEYLDRIGA